MLPMGPPSVARRPALHLRDLLPSLLPGGPPSQTPPTLCPGAPRAALSPESGAPVSLSHHRPRSPSPPAPAWTGPTCPTAAFLGLKPFSPKAPIPNFSPKEKPPKSSKPQAKRQVGPAHGLLPGGLWSHCPSSCPLGRPTPGSDPTTRLPGPLTPQEGHRNVSELPGHHRRSRQPGGEPGGAESAWGRVRGRGPGGTQVHEAPKCHMGVSCMGAGRRQGEAFSPGGARPTPQEAGSHLSPSWLPRYRGGDPDPWDSADSEGAGRPGAS